MFTHVLVPVDGSELSESALHAAIELARSLDARLTVFYALPTAGARAYATVPPCVERSALEAKSLLEAPKIRPNSRLGNGMATRAPSRLPSRNPRPKKGVTSNAPGRIKQLALWPGGWPFR